jgi:hypothetical protein
LYVNKINKKFLEYLYYKERRQSKTFLTQFGSTLPLTLDPPVRLRDDQKGGTTIKSQFGEHFCQKRNVFLSHPVRTHPLHLLWARPTQLHTQCPYQSCWSLRCSFLSSTDTVAQVNTKLFSPYQSLPERHGYPWVPTNQGLSRPRQAGPTCQKTS